MRCRRCFNTTWRPARSTEGNLADLNADGVVDGVDWSMYKSGFDQDLSLLSPLASFAMGDLNGDLANDHADFVLFKSAYDAANGTGAFDTLLAAVPEPSTMTLLITAWGMALYRLCCVFLF